MSIGQPLTRREDQRFLTGRGRYTENTAPREALAVLFVRSPHAHARIAGIDKTEALALPGIVAVYTAEDTAADRLGHPRTPRAGAIANRRTCRWRPARSATSATSQRWSWPRRSTRRVTQPRRWSRTTSRWPPSSPWRRLSRPARHCCTTRRPAT
ncbi:MAG: hypothetical protein E6G95_18500 [Alphaproteobacteria bacterium]|nr:MAG: hypothetical protein E6G95_18500 [Alphaproteobacteria bacterium]